MVSASSTGRGRVSLGGQALPRERDASASKRIGRPTAAALFVFSWAFLGCFVHTIDQRAWNVQHAWIEAMGGRGEFHLDGATLPEFRGLDDDTYVAPDGHRYARNAPGTYLYAAVLYGALHRITGLSYRNDFDTVSCLVAWGVTGFATALTIVLLAQLGAGLTGSRAGGVTLGLAYGLGTLAFPWSGLPYQHQTAAVFVVATLLLGRRLHEGAGPWTALGAGLCLGLVPLTSYAQIPVAACVGIYALYRCRSHRERAILAAGALVALVPTLALNAAYWGGPFTTVYQASGDPEVVRIAPSWSRALSRLHFYLADLTSSMFVYSPVLALGLVGLFALPRRQRPIQVTALAGTAVTLLHLLIVGGYGAAQWGPRLVLPFTPLLAVGLAWWWGSRSRRAILGVVTAVSILICSAGASGPLVWLKTGKKNGVVAYMPFLVGKGNWRKTLHEHQVELLSAGGSPELRFPLREPLSGVTLLAGMGLLYCLARRPESPSLPRAGGTSQG